MLQFAFIKTSIKKSDMRKEIELIIIMIMIIMIIMIIIIIMIIMIIITACMGTVQSDVFT